MTVALPCLWYDYFSLALICHVLSQVFVFFLRFLFCSWALLWTDLRFFYASFVAYIQYNLAYLSKIKWTWIIHNRTSQEKNHIINEEEPTIICSECSQFHYWIGGIDISKQAPRTINRGEEVYSLFHTWDDVQYLVPDSRGLPCPLLLRHVTTS